MITLKEYWMGRDKDWPPSDLQKTNAAETVKRVNALLNEAKILYKGISSGYRPLAINSTVKGAATKSAHISCEAVDLKDLDGSIGKLIKEDHDKFVRGAASSSLLTRHNLYMESLTATKGWVHLQTRKTRSGARIFIP